MPRDGSEGSQDAERPQDPIVDRVRPDPTDRPVASLRMTGFLGDSDRAGFRRLYFTRNLDYYAEFRTEDVIHIVSIPSDQEPFRGEEATRVSLRRGAVVEYTRTRVATTRDEFDLDVRASRVMADLGNYPDTWFSCPYCPPNTDFGAPCPPESEGVGGCATPQTCGGSGCETCITACGTCYETCRDWRTAYCQTCDCPP